MIAGLVLATVVTALVVARHEQHRAEQERRSEAARGAADLRSRFELSLGALATIQGLFDASREVTGKEFATFAERLLLNSPFSSTMVVTRVPAPMRTPFEQSPGSSPIRDLVDGRLVRAGPRDEYYPVSYSYSPYEGFARRLPIGLDLAADPVRGTALRAARDRGLPQATSPVTLPESDRPGLVLLMPMYAGGTPLGTPAERQAAIQHLAVSSFDAMQLGDAVREGRQAGTQIQIFGAGRLIYGPKGALDDAEAVKVEAAGRTWKLAVQTPVEASMALPATILGGGLALTALVALLLTALGRRERYAQELSDRRLDERERAEGAWRAAEERFRRAFEGSGIGMALVGVSGPGSDRLLEANEALCKLTGYPRERLLKMELSRLMHPADSEAATAAARETVEGDDDATHSEQRLIDSRGEKVWVLLSASVVRDDAGSPTHRILQIQDVSERKRYEGRLQHLADHDPLTGLFNRRSFEDELSRILDKAARIDRGGAVLALDLDHFKYINDSLGHTVGDELITGVSALLSESLGDRGVVARLGGDEFAVIVPDVDEPAALELANDLLRTIRDTAVVNGHHGHVVGTTASVGIAMFGGDVDELAAQDLLAEADIAMYDAKEGGRDRCAVFCAGDRGAGMAARLGWVERIRQALAEDRFVLHGQRIESLDDDPCVREELLLRMIDDDGSLIAPGAFLYVAERFDLIQEIDRWVVKRAIALLAELQASGAEAVLEINVSAKSVIDPTLCDLIRSEVERSEVDPSGLVFEITETAAIVNLERAQEFAAFLHDLGCGFALDDFGAGFASFHYLKHFAFDYLKIDGEFVKELSANTTNQLLVHSLVQIARGLGKKTIAEVVEDADTLVLLRELGVDYVQGFHVGRPEPISAANLSARHRELARW